MIRSIATLTAVSALAAGLALGAAAPAAAESPPTIHGVVYDCATRHAIEGAYVTLRGVDNGETYRTRSDAHGRFTRVGLTPGRWLIEAATHPGGSAERPAASRLAMLESDDVLEIVIGTRLMGDGRSVADRRTDRTANPNAPHPICDPARVPQAPSTADRTIIH